LLEATLFVDALRDHLDRAGLSHPADTNAHKNPLGWASIRNVPDAAWTETDELRVAERSNPQIKSYVRPEEPPRKESMPCSAVTISVGT
jgi:hypothetical protein